MQSNEQLPHLFAPCMDMQNARHRSNMTCTVQNTVGLLPLAWLLGCTTEDLALRCGPVPGGLINASFGNAPELTLSIIALVRGLTMVALAS